MYAHDSLPLLRASLTRALFFPAPNLRLRRQHASTRQPYDLDSRSNEDLAAAARAYARAFDGACMPTAMLCLLAPM